MKLQVVVQWTETAKQALAQLPKKVRQGLLEKADELAAGGDPRQFNKPLTGPLQGYYRITCARYRAVYRVDEQRTKAGDLVLQIQVLFVAAGIRKERDKNDIYRIATNLVRFLLEPTSPVAKPPEPPRKKKKR